MKLDNTVSSKLDIEEAKQTLNRWLSEDYGKENVELIYKGIPRKIICEKFIETADGAEPMDIKVFCSYGEPKFIYTMLGDGDNEIQDYYLASWEHLPVRCLPRPNSEEPIERPENLDAILDYARKLAADFPIVRVDFYNENNIILFGELTFLTTGGHTPYDPESYDTYFGSLFPIEKELERKRAGK